METYYLAQVYGVPTEREGKSSYCDGMWFTITASVKAERCTEMLIPYKSFGFDTRVVRGD